MAKEVLTLQFHTSSEEEMFEKKKHNREMRRRTQKGAEPDYYSEGDKDIKKPLTNQSKNKPRKTKKAAQREHEHRQLHNQAGNNLAFRQMFQPYNDGSTVSVVPWVSAGIKSITKFALRHSKYPYIIIGFIILLTVIGLMIDIVLTMKYNNNANKKEDIKKINLAPFSVYKYNLHNTKLDIERVEIQLTGECTYDGLLQVLVEPKKVTSIRKNITREFTKLVRYWPHPSKVNGNIKCNSSQPIKITWYWSNADSSTSFSSHCTEHYFNCTKDNSINTAQLMGNKKIGNDMINIVVCDKGEQAVPRAEFQEELPNLSGASSSNLEIGENNNSTTIKLGLEDSKEYLYISTKHVQISHHDLDYIIVKITPYTQGVVWTLNIGIGIFLSLVFVVMIMLCGCIKKCQQSEVQYVTIAYVILKQQEHPV